MWEIDILITIASAAIGSGILSLVNSQINKKILKKEDREVKEEVEKTINKIISIEEEKQNDVLSLMINNVAELREYYIINKQQARNSFSAALFICILGFVIFSAGIVITYTNKGENVIQYTTIAGSIVELIAGLFFWLYSKAIKQINIFHSSLLGTQKFLTAIQLVENVSENKKDEIYTYIIRKIIDAKGEIEIDLTGNNK